MTRLVLAAMVMLLGLGAGACRLGTGTGAPPPVTLAGWAAQAPVWQPPLVPLSVDLPTFPPQALQEQGGGRRSVGPTTPSSETVAVLRQVAAKLDRTGRPAAPPGVPAVYIGSMDGNHFVYNLGPDPNRPMHESNRIYLLKRVGAGWLATRICREASDWVWRTPPAIVCGASHGSGAVLTAAVYLQGLEAFRLEGAENGVLQAVSSETGPPDLTVTFTRRWMEHKLDPVVVERVTLRWTNGTYRRVSYERMDSGWPYHLARFVALVEAGEWERAARHISPVPAEGVKAYLTRRAPGLTARTEQPWTTQGYYPDQYPRAYLLRAGTEGPWFWFGFAPDGRVREVGRAAAPPAAR